MGSELNLESTLRSGGSRARLTSRAFPRLPRVRGEVSDLNFWYNFSPRKMAALRAVHTNFKRNSAFSTACGAQAVFHYATQRLVTAKM